MGVKIFVKEEFGSIRTIMGVNNEPLFLAKDVAVSLGYANPRDAVIKHCDLEDVAKYDTPTLSGNQLMTYVNESGIYSLIFGSKLPKAKDFKRWVTSEVLPSIRKDGGYIATSQEDTEADIMAKALLIAQSTIERQKQRVQHLESTVAEQAPKALFADSVSASETSILIGDMAKLLNQNGVNMGQNRLFDWLRKNNYLCSRGEMRNMPTQRTMDMGLMEIKERTVINPDGSVRITKTPKILGKGQIYFINKFLKRK